MQWPRILLVEDNLILIQDLCEQLRGLGYAQLTATSDTQSAFQAFTQQIPDLAIIDIQLNRDKRGGILLARQFRQLRPIPIIFLTGLPGTEVLTQALQTGPVNYLLKPYRQEELHAAVLLALTPQYRFPPPGPGLPPSPVECYLLHDSFFAKQRDRYVKVDISEILWVAADNVLVEVITTPQRYLLSTTLKSFCQQIKHPDLIRVHRSYVVNIHRVTAFSEGQLYLKGPQGTQRIPVGPKYRHNFFDRIRRLQTK
ncbi:MAG: response regulator transcription factor [Bacteroidota bacterium]